MYVNGSGPQKLEQVHHSFLNHIKIHNDLAKINDKNK